MGWNCSHTTKYTSDNKNKCTTYDSPGSGHTRSYSSSIGTTSSNVTTSATSLPQSSTTPTVSPSEPAAAAELASPQPLGIDKQAKFFIMGGVIGGLALFFLFFFLIRFLISRRRRARTPASAEFVNQDTQDYHWPIVGSGKFSNSLSDSHGVTRQESEDDGDRPPRFSEIPSSYPYSRPELLSGTTSLTDPERVNTGRGYAV